MRRFDVAKRRTCALCPFHPAEGRARGAETSPHPRQDGAFRSIPVSDDFAQIEAACAVSASANPSSFAGLFAHRSTSGRRFPPRMRRPWRAIAKELRAIGRNIAQIVKGINLGYAPQLANDEELFRATHAWLDQIERDHPRHDHCLRLPLAATGRLEASPEKEPA